jgi:hypothetical protein
MAGRGTDDAQRLAPEPTPCGGLAAQRLQLGKPFDRVADDGVPVGARRHEGDDGERESGHGRWR